jgi:hypothetical protein
MKVYYNLNPENISKLTDGKRMAFKYGDKLSFVAGIEGFIVYYKNHLIGSCKCPGEVIEYLSLFLIDWYLALIHILQRFIEHHPKSNEIFQVGDKILVNFKNKYKKYKTFRIDLTKRKIT